MTLSSRFASLLLAGSLMALSAGCQQKITDPKDPKFVVATSKQGDVTTAELNDAKSKFFTRIKKSEADVPPAQIPVLNRAIITDLVVQRELVKMIDPKELPKIDKEVDDLAEKFHKQFPTEEAYLEDLKKRDTTPERVKSDIRRALIIKAVLDANVKPAEPTQAEIQAFYDENAEKFKQPEQVRFSQVLVKVPASATAAEKKALRKKIDAARARVIKNEEFAAVAKEISEDATSAPKGGDAGFVARGTDSDVLINKVFESKINVVSPVFETPYGFHFIKVTETQAAGQVPLEQLRPQITPFLMRKARDKAMLDFRDLMVAKADIKFFVPVDEPKDAPAGLGGTNAPVTPAQPAH